jgi:hypothetical protein
MFKSLTLVFLILQFVNQAFGQIDTVKSPLDSIYIAGYKAVYYRLAPKDAKFEYEWSIYSCDSLILSSDTSPIGVKMYNFCENAAGPRITCNFQDIDTDGWGEIIFEIPGKDKISGEKFQFFVPDLIMTTGPVFDGREKGYGKLSFNDIDNDGKLEILFKDLNFRCWHSHCNDSPEPYLVWKLDNLNYKLINLTSNVPILNNLYNFKIPLIGGPNWWAMSEYGPPIIDSLANAIGKVKYYNPNNDATYPIELAKIIIYLSFTNYDNSPKQLLDAAWPDSIPNKGIFWKELQNKIQSDPLWNDIQNLKLPGYSNPSH